MGLPAFRHQQLVAEVVTQELNTKGQHCLMLLWYWARTRDKASHGPIPIPLGYRGHMSRPRPNTINNHLPHLVEIRPSIEPVCENVSQVAEIMNRVYGADAVIANYMQFWFRRFRSGIFVVKDAPRPSSKMSIKSQK
ncbi:hypothetical protein TNCV_550281 [Trichonephila clavipes]|nr:hypothetical protein TNCV_550281 [Trichonephila clavipes]